MPHDAVVELTEVAASADPHHPSYTTPASADLADSTLTFLGGPSHARDIEGAVPTATGRR